MVAKGKQYNKLYKLGYFQIVLLLLILDAVPNLKRATVAPTPANHQPENQLDNDPHDYPENEQCYGDSCHHSAWKAIAVGAVGLWAVSLALSCIAFTCVIGTPITRNIGPSSKHNKCRSNHDIGVDLNLERESVWAESVAAGDDVYCPLSCDVGSRIDLG